MPSLMEQIDAKYKKKAVVETRSGDTVRVHQKVREGNKERVQIFEGLVIRTGRRGSLTSSITVRRQASGVGVEKNFLLHSPSILKVEVTKRSKVRRNYLSYMRARTGKRARLAGIDFDREAVNDVLDEEAEAEEAKIKEEVAEAAEEAAEQKAEEDQELEAKADAAIAAHDQKPDLSAEASAKAEAEKLEEQPAEKKTADGPATDENKE